MKNIRNYLIAALFIGVLVFIKFYFFPSVTSKGGPAKGGSGAPVNVTVEVARVQNEANNIFISGNLLAGESVNLQPEVQGKITGIYFAEGQHVAKGQLLVKLNDSELQAELKKFRAQAAIAEEKKNRLKKLLNMNGVSREEYESALTQWQSNEADVEVTEAAIAKTEIHAPFSGIIGLRNVSEGSYAGPGTIITTLQQTDILKLELNVPEKYISNIHNGETVKFSVEGFDGEFEAKVYAIDPKIDENTRSIRMRAICNNPGGKLKPGAFAKVEFSIQKDTKMLMIPTESIVPELNGQKVYLVKGGKSEPVSVTTGIRTSDRIEIVSGISEGDSVIVTGVLMIKPGSAVNIISGT